MPRCVMGALVDNGEPMSAREPTSVSARMSGTEGTQGTRGTEGTRGTRETLELAALIVARFSGC